MMIGIIQPCLLFTLRQKIQNLPSVGNSYLPFLYINSSIDPLLEICNFMLCVYK
jgi:hypothetical protein